MYKNLKTNFLFNFICFFIISCFYITICNSADIKDFYIEVKNGVSKPRSLNKGMIDFSVKNSYKLDIIGGYNFNKHFSLGMMLSYHPRYKISLNSKKNHEYSSHVIPVNYKHRGELSSLIFSINAYFNIIEVNGFVPYIGLGAGMARNKFNKMYVYYDMQKEKLAPGQYSLSKVGEESFKNSFMWQAMAGVKFKINKNCELSLEYKYDDLGIVKTGAHDTYFNGQVERDLVKRTNLRTNSFLIGFRYNL